MHVSLELRGEVQAGEVHLGDVGSNAGLLCAFRRSEVLGLGSGRKELVQAGQELMGTRSRDWIQICFSGQIPGQAPAELCCH